MDELENQTGERTSPLAKWMYAQMDELEGRSQERPIEPEPVQTPIENQAPVTD